MRWDIDSEGTFYCSNGLSQQRCWHQFASIAFACQPINHLATKNCDLPEKETSFYFNVGDACYRFRMAS